MDLDTPPAFRQGESCYLVKILTKKFFYWCNLLSIIASIIKRGIIEMEDESIIKLYLLRSETAINETDKKYHNYCNKIGFNILNDREDTEECINDCYLTVWNNIPPTIPENFRAFIGRVMRNISISLYRKKNAEKRSNIENLLEELDGCIPLYDTSWAELNLKLLGETIDSFLDMRNESEKNIFIKRYFFCLSIKEIAIECSLSSANVKVILHRVRKKLKIYLEKEGFFI